MKRLLLTMFALVSMLTWTVAQTDVTKFFLTNYAFDSNYNYTAGQSKSVSQEILEIPDWTQGFTVNYTITGIYEFGFAGTFNNGTVPSVGYDGEAGGGLALSTGWEQNFYYTQTVTLPAGKYTLTVPTYNGFTATGGTSLMAWTQHYQAILTHNIMVLPDIPTISMRIRSTTSCVRMMKEVLEPVSLQMPSELEYSGRIS